MDSKKAKLGIKKNISDDMLSSLPDDILHHIMSLLPACSAASTSVLSRRWEKLWLSFPSVKLDEIDFASRKEICDCLNSTLASRDLSALQTIHLCFKCPGTSQLYQHFRKFMNTVLVESEILKELDIVFNNHLFFLRSQEDVPFEKFCVLPEKMFSFWAHLIVLSFKGCRVKDCPPVNLPFLKTLSMKNVLLTEEFLLELVNRCPVLDTMSVKYCFGIKSIQICHPTLQSLVIGLRTSLKSFELNLPCLKSIKFVALFDSVFYGLEEIMGPKNTKKIIARNLEAVCFKYFTIESDVLDNLFLIFPNLNKLAVKFCEVLGNVRLHSRTLTALEMIDSVLPEEIYIKLPNLQSIDYLYNANGAWLDYMTFMHLRSISLDSIEVKSGVMWINSSICPKLARLRLAFCVNMKQLRVVNNNLESLEVVECEDLEYCMIVAPQLLTFSYTGHLVHMAHFIASRKLSVMLHLKEPEGGHEHVEDEFVTVLKESLHNVSVGASQTEIKLSYECVKCLKMFKDIDLPPLNFVHRVNLETWTSIMHLEDLLSCSLAISNYCNTISINVCQFTCTFEFEKTEKVRCVHKTQLSRVADHLVRVEMEGFTGNDPDKLLDLVEYIVWNARHLQEMRICMRKGKREETAQMCQNLFVRMLRNSCLPESCDVVNHGNCIVYSRSEVSSSRLRLA